MLTEAARLVVETLKASPSAVCAASMGGRRGAGASGARLETLFDLASVTKPVVAMAFARLEKRGVISRDESLGDALPLVRDTVSGRVPLDLFLSHRSGLEAHIRLFEPLVRGQRVDKDSSVVTAASARRAECIGAAPSDGFPPVYSDMGYLLVGEAMAARDGRALDEIVATEVLAPLGLESRIGSARHLRMRRTSFLDDVAPTEDIAFRGGVVRGLVHDENAFALSGDALSGHAGLFGDAGAVLVFGEAVLACVRGADAALVSAEEMEPLVRDRTGGSLLAGFDRKSGDKPAAGSRCGPKTFGHLGFTGTSLWIDPEAGFVGVLLSNRVHPTREHIAIRVARPVAYDAMFDALRTAA
jgi:CubicO group peptidase (beta-lactamase class C family)